MGCPCLSHSGGHAGTWHVLTCPLLFSLCQQGHLLGLGGDTPPAGTALARAQSWPLARLAALGSPSCGPCPSLPAGISAGEGGQAGTATQWWGIKGRKGKRKKNTPRLRQLTELAPGWGRVGTAAGLAWHGKGCGKESPLLCPSDPSLWPRETCRDNRHPLLSTRGTTTDCSAACATADEDPFFSLSPQVNDFLSGRSPLTLALRVGDHMMFVQLQLAAQQSTGQLQHRHLIASRGEAGAGASPHCRTLHGAGGSGFTRIPVVPTCQQSPAPSPTPAAPAPPMYCNAPHAAPVTAGMFRSHGASTQTVNSSVVSSCSEVSLGVSWEGLWERRGVAVSLPAQPCGHAWPSLGFLMCGNGLSPVWSPECPQVPGRGSRTGCNPSSYPWPG